VRSFLEVEEHVFFDASVELEVGHVEVQLAVLLAHEDREELQDLGLEREGAVRVFVVAREVLDHLLVRDAHGVLQVGAAEVVEEEDEDLDDRHERCGDRQSEELQRDDADVQELLDARLPRTRTRPGPGLRWTARVAPRTTGPGP